MWQNFCKDPEAFGSIFTIVGFKHPLVLLSRVLFVYPQDKPE
jgi:hypothetical protein